MNNLSKLIIVVLVSLLVIGVLTGCEKKIEPYTVDFSKAILGVPNGYNRSGDPTGFERSNESPMVPWTYTECTNIANMPPGMENCNNCPTCEGKTMVVMNKVPMTRSWEDFPIYLPPFPEDFDWNVYNKVRIRVRYYYDDFEQGYPVNNAVMVSFIYDTTKSDIRGPSAGPGPNTPMKTFGLTRKILPEEEMPEEEIPISAQPGRISSDEGDFVFLNRSPEMILFQRQDADAAYIEIAEVTFFGEKLKKGVPKL